MKIAKTKARRERVRFTDLHAGECFAYRADDDMLLYLKVDPTQEIRLAVCLATGKMLTVLPFDMVYRRPNATVVPDYKEETK